MSDAEPTPMDTTPAPPPAAEEAPATAPEAVPSAEPTPALVAAAGEEAAAATTATTDDAPMASAEDDADAAAQRADDERMDAEIREREAQEERDAEARKEAERLAEEARLEAEKVAEKARIEREKKEAEERATWTETLYINNLHEKVKIPVMKKCLEVIFGSYGKVLSITAHENVRMRGQAFVAFESKDIAAKALKEVNKFPLYGKPMQISFAKTASDAVVRKLDEAGFDSHLESRKEHKRKTRLDNPLKQKEKLKRKLASGDVDAAAEAAAAVGVKRAPVMMPEEYLPPNATLFVQNLMDGIGKEELEDLFGKYAGLVTVRTIAARKDIAFVDYADENASTAAKEGLNNHKLGPGEGEPMRVTFARK